MEIWVLVSASFVIALGFGIVAPALPQFALTFGVGETAATAVISAFALMRLLFAPASGRLVQRSGERPIYLVGLLIVALSTGACAFAQEYWQLLVFRSLGGVGSTMFTVSSLGLLIRIAPPQMRGRVSGLFATSFLLGSISGPLLGSALLGFGLRVPFVIYAVALLIAAAIVYFALRDSTLATPEAGEAVRAMTLREGLARIEYRAALWSSFANGWAVFGVRMAIIPLFVVEALERDIALGGIALTVFALGNALVLLPAGRYSDRFGRRPFLIVGSAVCGVSTIAMGFSGSLVFFFVASLIAGLGSGLINPSQQAAVADIVGSRARGGPVLATFQMMSDVGAVIGPIAAGALAQHYSYGAAFGVTGGILVAAAVFWLFVPETLVRSEVSARNADSDQRSDKVGGSDGDRA
ncbi:MFS transporter [Antrihabitans sp. YC2-6]|uniref:MFS transporter n=1 Tax=Antrihabitans sp. YC2-6 TaxID=2799498 RepID=UPI0018F4FDBA|nr:MFS transporter [Antrihabitans sp. YC2-6]MBJ8343538.1 MFS transporter [Antrihabitans sp. YC2-6]